MLFLKVVNLGGNDLNLQVVAVGCYDVAAEVAVAAVVGDWKGFWEGFPAKGSMRHTFYSLRKVVPCHSSVDLL